MRRRRRRPPSTRARRIISVLPGARRRSIRRRRNTSARRRMNQSRMNPRKWRLASGLTVSGLLLAAVGIASWAQQAPEHGGHGTPRDWKFSWPAGDAAVGREGFIKLECYTCHEVKGERFPKPGPGSDPGKV